MPILTGPGLDLASKTRTDSARALGAGDDVVAAQCVRAIERLHQWEFRVEGRVDFDGWSS
jgi:hypothetical protein